MNRPSLARHLLTQLHSQGIFGSSDAISKQSVVHYGKAIAWIERRLGVADRPEALWRLLAASDGHRRHFALRSSPVRATVDKLCGLIHQDQGRTDEAREQYA